MYSTLSTVLITLPCLSLSANTDGPSKAEQAREFVRMLDSTTIQTASEESTRRLSLGEMGEMIFSMSMHSHEEEHDRAHEDHEGMLELDLAELTGGQVAGQIVIDLNDLSDRDVDQGEFESNIDIQMIMEDEDGRREFSRSYGHDRHGHQNDAQWNPVPTMMLDDMLFMTPGQLPPGVVMGATGAMPGFAMGMAPGMPMHVDSDRFEELFHNQFQMMEELEYLRHQVDSFYGDDEGHRDDDHHAHMEEMMRHAHELEEHLDRHHDEMDDREREEVRREIEHIHHEIRHMEEEGHHDDHEDHQDQGDPFFGMATDFVHKIEMAGHMANSLGEREAIAVFGVWMARQHLEPEARVEMLSPMMKDESLYLSVRNAATWVVMDALGEMHRKSDAQNTLAELIRSNGSSESSD